MAGKTLRVLLRDRCPALVRETDDRRNVARVLHVRGAGTVTGFASLCLGCTARIEGENRRMNRMGPVGGLLLVAPFAGLLSHIGAIVRCRSGGCGRRRS